MVTKRPIATTLKALGKQSDMHRPSFAIDPLPEVTVGKQLASR